MKNSQLLVLFAFFVMFTACNGGSKSTQTEEKQAMFTGAKGEVKIMTLDPGHFHAALVQKSMYDQVDAVVHVYAPEGIDVKDHLKRIEGFNTRAENPTSWEEITYTGVDYLEEMIAEKPGNVMMVSGNNAKKTAYIKSAVDAGINVFADKPMVINSADFAILEEVFKTAEANGILLYDIMTERHEITTMLQRMLSQNQEVFGQLKVGSVDEPAITKESVHHFYKYVAGSPLKRPAWFFDTEQQGEGIVDVNTHLVDLIQWEAFPEVILSKEDVEIVSAKRWTTDLTPEMFKKVTHLDSYPEYLKKDVEEGVLKVYSNGEINYKLKGIHAKASVTWNYEAPEGAKDTHYSIMRGTKCNLTIEQGAKEGYKPKLYIEASVEEGFEANLNKAVQDLSSTYSGIGIEKIGDNKWALNIPDRFKVGHEAHFGQVTEKYLTYLIDGKLPAWEVPNMITKYYTTTKALEMAK